MPLAGCPCAHLRLSDQASAFASLEAQLAADYRRVAVVDGGRVELYERLGTDAARDGEARRTASSFCQGFAGG